MAVNKIVKKEKDWFKLKRYPHIDYPLLAKDRYVWIEPYVTNPLKVAAHNYLRVLKLLPKLFRKLNRRMLKHSPNPRSLVWKRRIAWGGVILYCFLC